LRIGNFEHKPSPVIVLLFILFAAALLFLGTWQMQRAALKTSILAAAAESGSLAPVKPSDITDLARAASEHTRVTLTGSYQGEKQFLWDNRVYQGQAGFEVITPVLTDAGIVLVNRGWVAPGRTRQDLPDVALSRDVLGSAVTINGVFSRPSKGFASGEAFSSSEAWPRVLQYFDYPSIELALGATLLAGVVQPQQKGQANEQRAEYFAANWEPIASIGPARHYGYAFQWYAMAAALSILYIVYNTRRIESSK